jgi:16S rRNA (cytosine1402-N4)-methyltransferase
MTSYNQHQAVLLSEVLQGLAIKPDGIYIDATFGRGGHSRAILDQLSSAGQLLAIDKDLSACAYAKQHFADDSRFSIQHGSFTQLINFVTQNNWLGKVNGILLDLGVSSPQLEEPQRGFSFLRDGPLDMRMDTTQPLDASTWINSASETDISDVLHNYGEERFARRIARAIVRERQISPINTTQRFAEIVTAANPAWERHKHPATRSFQALRIFINHELDELTNVLTQCLEALTIGGRLAVISFHSLEDRLVKHFIRDQVRGDKLPKHLPIRHQQLQQRLRSVGRAIKPSATEIQQNPRARSAVLRLAEKLL